MEILIKSSNLFILQEQTEKYYNSLIRVQADFDNYKKIAIRDKNRVEVQAKERLLKRLLRHYDDLLRTKKAIEVLERTDDMKKGFEMIVKNFEKFLEEENVSPMNCEGEAFDPYKTQDMLDEIAQFDEVAPKPMHKMTDPISIKVQDPTVEEHLEIDSLEQTVEPKVDSISPEQIELALERVIKNLNGEYTNLNLKIARNISGIVFLTFSFEPVESSHSVGIS